MRRVAVLGIGETAMGKYPEKTLRDLILEAGTKALADAGMDRAEIQALYIGNFNGSHFCRQSHVGPLAAETLQLGLIPAVRTEGACASGSMAFRLGYQAVACGIYDAVLVGGVEKMTHCQTEYVTEGLATAADADLEVPVGVTFPSVFALMANRYFHEFGNARDAMAWCAVQNHENALLNPDAQLKKRITVEDVKNGTPIADPFTIYDCSLVTDGAVFAVLAESSLARSLSRKRLVEVVGCAQAGDAISMASKNSLTTLAATVKAANEAYIMAGLKPADIDLAEVHDCFTITEILNIEDLGFFAKGTGARAILSGATARDGRKPINVSGGLKAKGHPIGATGLSQIYEIVTQLRHEAGERQVMKADIGLTHNLGGSAATCIVSIFRGR
ncbi:MAG TPA: thiolase domain-containing protein [Syntrophales bacterium]|nr:thiolase domain-containing protein [Syntrophales bacterium]